MKKLAKNDILSLLFLIFITTGISSYLTYKIVTLSEPYINRKKLLNYFKVRYIKLREWPPFEERYLVGPDIWEKDKSPINKKYRIRADENGFLKPSKIHDNPDLSIVFLGGSTTECSLIDEEKRFPYLTGRILEKETGKRINSYNAAVFGNNSLHSLNILLNKVLPLKPKIVVMMHNCNDLTILLLEKTYWNKNPYRAPIVLPVDDPTIFSYEKDAFIHLRGQKIVPDENRMASDFRDNLQIFINICNAKKIIPVLMTQQSRLTDSPDSEIAEFVKKNMEESYGISYTEYKHLFDLFNDVIREVGRENKILVIDLAGKIPQDKQYIVDIIHFTPTGTQFAAKIISKELKTLILTDNN